MLSSVVAPVTAGSASVPLLVKLLFGPVPRSAMATRSVSRPPPVVSAKCLRLNRPLLTKLLLPPMNCTKPVMVPLLMMLVLLLRKNGLPATARSDSAPMLPLLVRVAVPPDEPRITPAAGTRLNVADAGEVSLPAAHHRSTLRDVDRHVTARGPRKPAANRVDPGAELSRGGNIIGALTCTVPVVEAAQMPCAPAPCVVIAPAPDAVTMMFPPGSAGAPCVALRIVPLSATMPSASAPLVVIGPDEAIVMPPLLMPGPPPLRARARMPKPCPPSVVMPGPV